MTTPVTSPATPRSRTSIFFSYIRHELWRNLRMVDSLIFLIALPLVIFAVFGVASPGTDKHIPGGTIAAYVMVSLALYGAATAATSMAGAAAVEHDSGWGRHLALTGMRRGDYLAGKIIVSLLIACLPIGATFLLGILTTAQFDTPGIWLASAGLCLVGVFPFAFFGLAVALALRSETAVSIASGVVVLLATRPSTGQACWPTGPRTGRLLLPVLSPRRVCQRSFPPNPSPGQSGMWWCGRLFSRRWHSSPCAVRRCGARVRALRYG